MYLYSVILVQFVSVLAYNGYSFCFVVVLVGVTVIAQIIANSKIALLRSAFSQKN
jgi:hypothetical protein